MKISRLIRVSASVAMPPPRIMDAMEISLLMLSTLTYVAIPFGAGHGLTE
jgi:hypothetical protein